MLPLAHSRCTKSCHRYGEILPPVQSNLATCQIQRSPAARRFRSEQTGSKVRIARQPPRTPKSENSWPAVFPECVDDLALTESRVIIREGCRTLPAKRVVTVELCLIDSQRYFADNFAARSKYGRARCANRGRRFMPDTPGHYVFRSQSLVRYPPRIPLCQSKMTDRKSN